jgi:iron complex outermembrane receptor protein
LGNGSNGTGAGSNLAGRFNVYGQVRDGLITNLFDGNKLNDQDRLGVRGQLLWAPADELLVRVIGEYGMADQKCCVVPLLAPVSASVQSSDDYMGYKRPGTNPYDRVTDNDRTTRSRLLRRSLSVIAEWTPPGRHSLTSLTGLNGLDISPTQFDDGTSMRLVNSNITSKSSQFTQEVRLNSRFLRAETTVGMFYIHQRVQGRERAVLGDEIARWALGGVLRSRVPGLTQQNSGFVIDAVLPPQALNGLTLNTPYSQVSDSYSTFASTDFKLSPNTVMTAGLRWTASNRRAEISRDRSGGNLNSSPLSLTNNLAVLSGLLGQNVQNVTYDGIIDSLVGPSFERQDTRKDHGASGKLALKHQINTDTSVYASAATGYKSGGLNLAGITRQVKPQFEPETASNFEVGLNKVHPSGKLSYNLSLYNTRIKNYQALTHDEGEGLVANPRPNNVINISKVRLRGVEFDLSSRLTPTFSLYTGLAYNQAISTEFTNAPNEDTGQNNKNLSGEQLYNAPRWSGFVGLEHRIPHQDKNYTYWGLDYQFRSGTFGSVDQSRSSFIEGYQITNLRLGYRNQQEGWGVQAWVRNVFDEDYLQAVSTLYSVGELGGYAGDPRTYGVTVDVKLGR